MNDEGIIDDLSLTKVNNEYDSQILHLKEQLSIAKEERKKTENEYNIIKHRLIKLKNQETTNYINFQNIKYRFNLILKNRVEMENKMNNYRKNKNKKFKNSSLLMNYGYSTSKKNKKEKTFLCRNKTHNNFYSELNENFLAENKNNYLINKNDYNDEEKGKNIFKEKLIEKLKKDVEEKKRIEEEIANIEKEEYLLMNEFNKGK